MQEKVKYISAAGLVFTLMGLASLFFKDHRWRGRLIGGIEYQETPNFSTKSWLNGEFQKDAQLYLEQNIGLRNYFVRSRNQVYFSVFSEPTAREVVIGKNNFFFELNYIKEYVGENAIETKKLAEFTRKAKVVQDSLLAQGKEFLIVIAPGKASMFPEHIPDKWDNKPRGPRNHDVVLEALIRSNISVMDASTWFVNMNAKSKYPLYCETGIHWSFYGEALFLDSLTRYLNNKNIHVPTLSLKPIRTSKTPKFPDDDIEQGMNLLFDIPNETLAYPELNYSHVQKSSNALLIGDSYLWNMYVMKRYSKLFNRFSLYFYNEDRYTNNYGKDTKVNPTIFRTDVNQSNCVILLATEANLHRLYFDSIEDLYEIVTNTSQKQ